MSTQIYSVEKKNYYKAANIVSIAGGFLVTILSFLPINFYTSYQNLYSLYLSLYSNTNELNGTNEVISRSLLFKQCQNLYSNFQTVLVIFAVFCAIYVILIGTLYLISYIKSSKNK